MNLMALRFCTHRSLHFYSYRETTDSVPHLFSVKNHLRHSMECLLSPGPGQKNQKNKIQVKLSLTLRHIAL